MKSSTLLCLILAIALVIVSGKLVANNINDNDKQETAVKTNKPSGSNGELKEMDIKTEFNNNAFTFFETPLLLMAGDEKSNNAMTIGWGAVGTIWDKPAMTVYVAESRYTHQFMETTKYFTVMKISDKVLEYMGSHSGRDGDKTKALNLHVAYTSHGAPYYKEATEVYECEVMYSQQFSPKNFRNSVPKLNGETMPGELHSMYIGEVVGAWRK